MVNFLTAIINIPTCICRHALFVHFLNGCQAVTQCHSIIHITNHKQISSSYHIATAICGQLFWVLVKYS